MLRLFKHTVVTRGWPTWARYAATLLIVLITLQLRLALADVVPGSPFLLFVPAIILSAALFDHGAGVFAVLLSAAFAKWFLIEPTGTLAIDETSDLVALSLFVAIGLITAAVLEALHQVASDLAEANRRLIAAEHDKDILLQEASHRFKNELTMLTALLRLQERSLEDEAARAALRSTANRVQVLGRVHEQLQRSDSSAVVDTREFITSLCDDLKLALIASRPITLAVDAESHRVPQVRVVPIGLIINELLTNALKYAFPQDRPAAVAVHFARHDGEFCLTVTDDGVGMTFDHNGREGTGLGQRLVGSMVAQLQGSVDAAPDSGSPGTVVTVRFPTL
jgi:two-component system, sensor histidine kinase PdtaS